MSAPPYRPNPSFHKRNARERDDQRPTADLPPDRRRRRGHESPPGQFSANLTSQHFQDLAQFQGDLSRIPAHGPHTMSRHPPETAQHSQYGRTEYHFSTADDGHSFSQTLQTHHESRTQHATESRRYGCNERAVRRLNPKHPNYPPQYFRRKPVWLPFHFWQRFLWEQQWASEHMYDLDWDPPEREQATRDTQEPPPRDPSPEPLSMPPPPLPTDWPNVNHQEGPLLPPASNMNVINIHDYATTAGGSPRDETERPITMVCKLARPARDYELTDPWADLFGTHMCQCGGRFFHHCVFPKNHCTATYLCYGGDPRCTETAGETDGDTNRDCTCAQRNYETGEWGSGGRIKCLQKLASKASVTLSEMPEGHPRDRLSAFAARCLARSKMENDGVWWDKSGVWCGH